MQEETYRKVLKLRMGGCFNYESPYGSLEIHERLGRELKYESILDDVQASIWRLVKPAPAKLFFGSYQHATTVYSSLEI